MTFLPIAARELTVAARRRGTYRLRAWSVLIALVSLCVVCQSNVPRGQLGQMVLSVLGFVTMGFCLWAGLLLTSESIAAERQEGTIGLLFLTDLRGYDIVLGKLAAHSISAFFGLLAIFPVLALPLLMGGVTGLEFTRLLLVFGTTLFFSLSLGLAVSAKTDDPRRALGQAFMWMAAVAGLLPVLWWVQNLTLNLTWLDFLLWPSPAFAYHSCLDAWYHSRSGAASFWHSMATIWLLTALCLAWASCMTPRAWQTGDSKYCKTQARRRKPRGWVRAEANNPYCRVTIRDWAPSSLANLLLVVAVPLWLVSFFFIPRTWPPVTFIICLYSSFGFHLLVKLFMMVEGVSRLNHDRNRGALELLLVTPLPVASILAAQRQSMRAHFRSALWMLCLMNLAMISALFGFDSLLSILSDDKWTLTEILAGGLVVLLVDFEAFIWIGMWRGLTKRRVYKAVIFTALQLLAPSWLLIFLIICAAKTGFSSDTLPIIIAGWFLAGLVVDALSIFLARWHLTERFRDVAANNS